MLGSLVAHAALSALGLRRRGLRRASAGQRAHLGAGLFLLVFIGGHVLATRGASARWGIAPGFEGLAFTLKWVPAYFWPYYLLLGISGAVHGALGLTFVASARRFSRVVLGVLAVTSTAGVLALGGAFFDVGHPERGAYAQLLGRLGLARLDPEPRSP